MMNIKKILKYLIIIMISLMVSKYIVLWLLPSSFVPEVAVMPNAAEIQDMPKTVELVKKEIELSIDYTDLRNRIKSEYQGTLNDIDRYIKEQIDEQRDKAYYQISKEDGFLDWVFGYFIGYKMMWKKIKGYFGSDDNEIKMVSNKFQNDVIQPGFDNTLKNIQVFSRNRIEDYYKSVIAATAEHLNAKTAELKKQGYTNMEVESKSIPWSKYIVSGSAESFVLLELTGVTSISVITGKVVGSKVAALLGPKMLALVSAKTASVVAGKIAASFSLIFAPLVDWAINETSKQIQYDATKKDFEKMISEILADTQKDIEKWAHNVLLEVNNNIYKELNKQTKIKAVK